MASQHRHVVECVDRSLKDLMSREQPFGGITTLFGGDFRQTLPVVPHGSREQIVSAVQTHSNIWRDMGVHYLHQNMRLGQDPECDQWAQRLLEIGITDGNVELPEHMRCGNNIESLITAVYNDLLDPDHGNQLADQYFLDRTILTPRNAEVHELNSIILNRVSGKKKECLSVDKVSNREYEYIPQKVLNSLDPSGFPFHKLELKDGAPLMLLRNLNPIHGLYNGTQLKLIRSTRRVLECHVLGNNDIVLIPRVTLGVNEDEYPIPL